MIPILFTQKRKTKHNNQRIPKKNKPQNTKKILHQTTQHNQQRLQTTKRTTPHTRRSNNKPSKTPIRKHQHQNNKKIPTNRPAITRRSKTKQYRRHNRKPHRPRTRIRQRIHGRTTTIPHKRTNIPGQQPTKLQQQY
jgi:hypothetical protein